VYVDRGERREVRAWAARTVKRLSLGSAALGRYQGAVPVAIGRLESLIQSLQEPG
jgi:hypothetical protein